MKGTQLIKITTSTQDKWLLSVTWIGLVKKYVLPTKLPAQRRNILEAIVCEDSGLGRFCLYNTKKSIGFLGLVMEVSWKECVTL